MGDIEREGLVEVNRGHPSRKQDVDRGLSLPGESLLTLFIKSERRRRGRESAIQGERGERERRGERG